MKNVEPCSRPTQKYIPMGQAHSKPLPWSNSTSAQYLTLQIENWMKKKSKHVGLAQRNGFGPAILPCLLLLVQGTAKAQHLP